MRSDPLHDTRWLLARAAVAAVWLYNGMWCKLLAGCPSHAAIFSTVPAVFAPVLALLPAALGGAEVALAVWVASGWRRRLAAVIQTALLVSMNAGGLVWGGDAIQEPGGLVVQNAAFLALVWLVALEPR